MSELQLLCGVASSFLHSISVHSEYSRGIDLIHDPDYHCGLLMPNSCKITAIFFGKTSKSTLIVHTRKQQCTGINSQKLQPFSQEPN
jgi:hypothetical protein